MFWGSVLSSYLTLIVLYPNESYCCLGLVDRWSWTLKKESDLYGSRKSQPLVRQTSEMTDDPINDEGTLRGTKRKAEESNLASQAPKRIKVAYSE